MNRDTNGILIAVEGADGSGKSTLARHLSSQLTNARYTVVLTKESGGTPLGKQLHTIVQEQKNAVCDKAEYLLFAADRAQHMHEIIEPALQIGSIVISDRMGDSSVAYQGYGRGIDTHMIQTINKWAQNERKPDLTVFIEIDLETAYQRRIKRGKQEVESVFEQEKKEFMQRVITGYQAIMLNKPNVIRLDGKQTEKVIAQEAFEKVTQWIEKTNK